MNTEALTLNTTTTCDAPHQHASRALAGLAQVLRSWIGRATLDPRGRYLSQAVDNVDLEMRMQHWEAREQRDARSFCGGHWV